MDDEKKPSDEIDAELEFLRRFDREVGPATTAARLVTFMEVFERTQEVLGETPHIAVCFVENFIFQNLPTIYDAESADGLFHARLCGWELSPIDKQSFNGRRLDQLFRTVGRWWAAGCHEPVPNDVFDLRLAPEDADAIIAAAGAAAGVNDQLVPADEYPIALRAAIDAFAAVQADPSATSGTTPKQALMDWLMRNRPELSKNARERIAEVANWRPGGGAPKTPG